MVIVTPFIDFLVRLVFCLAHLLVAYYTCSSCLHKLILPISSLLRILIDILPLVLIGRIYSNFIILEFLVLFLVVVVPRRTLIDYTLFSALAITLLVFGNFSNL